MSRLDLSKHEERQAVLQNVLDNPSINIYRRVDMVEHVLHALWRDFSWSTLELFADWQLRKALLLASPHALSPLVNSVLSALPARRSLSLEEFETVTSMIPQLPSLVGSSSENFWKSKQLFLSVLPKTQHLMPVMRLLMSAHLTSKNSDIDPEFVDAVLDRIAVLIPGLHPNASLNSGQKIGEVLSAASSMGVFNRSFLEAMLKFFLEWPELQMSFHYKSGMKIPEAFSQLAFPAEPLFARISQFGTWCDGDGMKPATAASSLIHIAWSYLAQGLEPPTGMLLMLADKCEVAFQQPNLIYGSEMMWQLMPFITKSTGRDFPVLKGAIVKDNLFQLRLAAEVQVLHPNVDLGVLRPEGLVHLAALVERDSGDFLPWPKLLPSKSVTFDNAATLPGKPVALLISSVQQRTLKPAGLHKGLLQMTCKLLEASGWAVGVMFKEELAQDRAWGKDHVEKCVQAMRDAGMR